ncbi:hypothetical protein CDAR_543811 [Caerostris darwini]|uniref:Uncharacterized protein n=1 Tax=Caerostris darwini TaxID=1538125 RepID=A0AAV4VKW6_9ARAC|nr:hypothetical protein CDAR_543811 [Caerostris darwini]
MNSKKARVLHFPSSAVYSFATRDGQLVSAKADYFLGGGGERRKGKASPTPLEVIEFRRLIFFLSFFFCQSLLEKLFGFLGGREFSFLLSNSRGKAMRVDGNKK